MSLIVLEPGLDSRIVDLGRPRTRSLGVPVGGAADRRSLMLGNALIGNPPDAAALEIALKGPRLRAESDVGGVVFGAPFDVWHEGGPVGVRHTFTLRAGEELRIGGTRGGARAYLCVCGGFQTPMILDSRSGLEPVRQGEVLSCRGSSIRRRSWPTSQYHFPTERGLDFGGYPWAFPALPGLQASWFDETQFYGQIFTVSPVSNRMGLRLTGNALTLATCEIASEPVCPGCVQVTNDGQCIILGVDGQTIGGYPKIAQVIQSDLDMIGQLAPGSAIAFEKLSLAEAIKRDRKAQAELRYWTMRLQLSLDAFPAERRFASS
jgi:antagonist of KipI